jgi:hypothetical protein
MAIDCIDDIPGAAELSNWFGGFPSFHDAKMDLQINVDGTGWLKAYGFRLTRDEAGFPSIDGYFLANFHFAGLKAVSITDFMPGLAILGQLNIVKSEGVFELDFTDTVWGLSGTLSCKQLSLTFEPDVKAPS